MNVKLLFILSILMVSTNFSCHTARKAQQNDTKIKQDAPKTANTVSQQTEIDWISVEELSAKNAKQPKKVLVSIYADWCGWCKKMDKDTYKNAQLINYINQNYHAVKLNSEDKKNIPFQGKTYKFVNKVPRGYHELAANFLEGQLSYPGTIFLDESLDVIQGFLGYKKPQDFDVILAYFAQNEHKITPWQDFVDNYQSTIPPTVNK